MRRNILVLKFISKFSKSKLKGDSLHQQQQKIKPVVFRYVKYSSAFGVFWALHRRPSISPLLPSFLTLQPHQIFHDSWNKSCLFPYPLSWLERSSLSPRTSHHSCSKDWRSTCHVPGSVLGFEVTIMRVQTWPFHRAYVLVGDILRMLRAWS